MTSVIKFTKANINAVSIDLQIRNKAKRPIHFFNIRYKNPKVYSNSLLLQTPSLLAPFGASSFDSDSNDKKPRNFNVCLSLSDDAHKKMALLIQFIEDLEEKVCKSFASDPDVLKLINIKSTKKNGTKKKISELQEELENNRFSSLLKRNGDYPPLLRTKLIRDRGNTEVFNLFCETVNADGIKNQVTILDGNVADIFSAGSRLQCIIHFSNIWVVNGRFGISASIKKCVVHAPKNLVNFISDSEEENEENGANDDNNEDDLKQDEEQYGYESNEENDD